MQSAFILRVSSQALSAMFGGMAVFCLLYAVWLPSELLLFKGLICGAVACAIVYCQRKWLD
jgi:hypothetical protein